LKLGIDIAYIMAMMSKISIIERRDRPGLLKNKVLKVFIRGENSILRNFEKLFSKNMPKISKNKNAAMASINGDFANS